MAAKHEFMHAVDLGRKLQEISATDLKELHAVGGRCQWCQQCLDTWLLVHIYAKIVRMEAKLNKLGGLDE